MARPRAPTKGAAIHTNALPIEIPSGDEPAPEIVDVAVLRLVAREPDRAWRVSEIVRAAPAGGPVLPVMASMLRLHRDGRLERVGPATYRLARGPADTVARRNERSVWG